MERLRALRRDHLPLLLVLGFTLLLGIPAYYEPPWYDDEGIYAAVAHAMLEGETIYRDTLDNRPPVIYFIYALLLGIPGAQLLMIKIGADLALIAEQVLLYHLGRRLWSPAAGLVAAATAGVLFSLPLLEGNIANAEVFMAAPIALGILMALRERWVWAGFFLSIAFLIKQIAGLEFVAVAGAIALWSPRPLGPLVRLAAGFSAPVLVVVGYLAQQEALGEFLFAGFGYYVGYVQRGTRIPATPEFFLIRLITFMGVGLLVWRHFRGHVRSQDLVSRGLPWLWLVAAAYGALFTARPYPHYLLEAVPPLSLILAPYLTIWRTAPVLGWSGGRLLAAFGATTAAVWIFVVIYMPWQPWANPSRTVAYYENFLGLMTANSTIQQYNDFFDKRVNRNLAIVSYLQEHATPGSYVLVWGDEPWIYPLAGIVNPTRYNVSYFAYEVPTGLDEVANAVRARKPRFVVWTKNKPLYPKLKDELDAHYRVVIAVENADILERIESGAVPDRVQSLAAPQRDQ